MPQVYAAVVWIFTSKAVAAVIIKTILINVALGAVAKALGPKRSRGQAPQINVTVRNSTESRRVIFGKMRAGGVFVYYNTSGTNNKYLHYVVAFTSHQVSAVEDVWLDTVKILHANINASTGEVTQAPMTGKLSIWRHTGTSTQAVDSALAAAFVSWTSTAQLKGCSYVHVRMERDDTAWPQGAPYNVNALIKGALLYDPRLDSTNGGSGSHRRTDPSTWAWSTNPALVLRWIISGGAVTNDVTTRKIMFGLREADSRIDDAYTISAANECDENMTGSYTTPDGDQKRYTCNAELSCGESRREWIETVLATMAGSAVYVSGKWRFYAGSYATPTHALTDADIFGDLEIQDTNGVQERYNAVAGVFRDATNHYIEQTTQFRTDSAYETQDGSERLPLELDLRGVTNDYAAQRLCEIHKRKSRLMRTVKITGSLNLLKIALNETFTLTNTKYGWSARVFRCVERQFDFGSDAGQVRITGITEASTVWSDMVTADYTAPNTHTPIYNVETPEPPTGFNTSGQPNAILLTWTKSATRDVGYEVEESTSSSMTSPTVVYAGVDNQVMVSKSVSTTYYYRVRAVKFGNYSAYAPSSGGISGAALSVSTALGGSASPTSATSTGAGSSQTTNSVTVTASGGTTPYTYAWTWQSGGTSITIDSSSAATTTFSATSLSAPETRTGTARCTITDNVAATKTVDISVSISRDGPLTVTASPSSRTKYGTAADQTTASVTTSASGGTSPYTYLWSWDSGGTGITINSTTSATTTFTATGMAIDEIRTGYAICTVTDNVSNVADSNTVYVYIERVYAG